MPDLGIIEIIIALMLFLPLCRPYIKTFAKVDGFVWLPPIAFVCLIALFPAYGFRPECLPLVLFAFIHNVLNLQMLFASIAKLRYNEDSERGLGFFAVMLVLLVAVEFIALRFLPVIETSELVHAQNVTVRDSLNNNTYYVRVYGNSSAEEPKPLLLVVPPVIGSAAIVDTLCDTLAAEGGMVMSFSRKDFDIPAISEDSRTDFPSGTLIKKSISSLLSGTKREKANRNGRFFEAERLKDIEFIIPFAIKNYMPSSVRIAGWGAGGAALVLLNDEFINQYDIESAVIIESPFYSFFEAPKSDSLNEEPHKGGVITQTLDKVDSWLKEHSDKKVEPMPNMPLAAVPISIITSDLINSKESYRALKSFVNQNKNIIFTPVRGAGQTDFCDAPLKYPFITALVHGKAERVWQPENSVHETARLILEK